MSEGQVDVAGNQPASSEFPIDDFVIDSVVVYLDRAEVTRVKTVTIPSIGEHQVIVHGLSKQTNFDSIRVKTINSPCDILEVSHQEDFLSIVPKLIPTENTSSINSIKEKISSLEDEKLAITKKLSRVENQRVLLKTYAENSIVMRAQQTTPISVETARDIIAFHQEETEKLDKEVTELTKQSTALANELKVYQSKLKDLTDEDSSTSKKDLVRSLYVTIDVKEASQPIALQFSYVVSNATWSPSYDMRFGTTGDNTLSLSYFAEVTQKTGENWKNCKLALSTSNPSIGSDPPSLPSKVIDFGFGNYHPSKSYGGGGKAKKSLRTLARDSSDDECDGRRASFALLQDEQMLAPTLFSASSQAPSDFKKAGVVGTGDAGSTVFTIQRLVSIDGDNKPHKVMITAREFVPQIVHYAVPSVSPSVYLQAKVRNNSPFPLLASRNVSIYLDGNFMSKGVMKQASSGESFQIFLGVDPAVKVEYLPVRKEQYSKGWMTGRTEVRKLYHSTILHNTKSVAIKVILAECLPRAINEKITIDLIEPSPNSLSDPKANMVSETSAEDAITNLTQYVSSNPVVDGSSHDGAATAAAPPEESFPKDFITKNKTTNNIVWLKTIASQQKVQINFSYRVSWPHGMTITEYDT